MSSPQQVSIDGPDLVITILNLATLTLFLMALFSLDEWIRPLIPTGWLE